MPCTTILVGKKATYDGSTMMARNEDAPAGRFNPKKFVVVKKGESPKQYVSVLSGVKIDLPSDAMQYTACPNAINNEGIWGEAGINVLNVAMSETETITSNARVLAGDPLIEEGKDKGGIGEEDMLTLVLPYIKTAKEGCFRLGELLEKYGTYEMNGIGFQDENEIWWFETIGGHHWIAKRVPDDAYVVMPNQQGIESFDFVDAFGEQKNYLCSKDMIDFITKNHLDLSFDEVELAKRTNFDVRAALGSHSDFDRLYNTPRAWFMLRYLNPKTYKWDGPNADFTPESDNLPWSLKPERKVTVEDVKYLMSAYYQGTKWDPYARHGDLSEKGKYRPIGVNRNNFVALTHIRGYLPDKIKAIEWIAYGSNVFNAFIPQYARVDDSPAYLKNTNKEVTTESFYWTNRLIGALADPHFNQAKPDIDHYQTAMESYGEHIIKEFDDLFIKGGVPDDFLDNANLKIADAFKKSTSELLNKVLYVASLHMKNAYSRSDA